MHMIIFWLHMKHQSLVQYAEIFCCRTALVQLQHRPVGTRTHTMPLHPSKPHADAWHPGVTCNSSMDLARCHLTMTENARAASASSDKSSRRSGRACHAAKPARWSGGARRTTASDGGAQERGCAAVARTRGCGAGAPDSCCGTLQWRIRPGTGCCVQNG